MRKFLFSYHHDGAQWSFDVTADSPEDAKAKVAKMAFATYDGEQFLELPVNSGWLARAIVGLLNWWRRVSD